MPSFSVVIVTELLFPLSVLIEFNKEAREANTGFIFSLCLGLHGFVFTDFGEKHIIRDESGANTSLSYISGVMEGKKTTLFLCDDVEYFVSFRIMDFQTENL